jgi:hypothetical protein
VRGSNTGAVAEGLGFAIPINAARAVAEQIMQKGYFARPYPGVRNELGVGFLERHGRKILVGGQDQGRAVDRPQLDRNAPTDHSVHRIPIGGGIILGSTLDESGLQSRMLGFREEPFAQYLPHLAHAQQVHNGKTLPDAQPVFESAHHQFGSAVDYDHSFEQFRCIHCQLEGDSPG